MIRLTFSQNDIDNLNYERFYHPDPIVMKRCETVYMHAKGLKSGAIHKITGRDVKTIREHLHRYKNGGLDALKSHENYKPKSNLDEHKVSIEKDFRNNPPASVNEARERIFALTNIQKSRPRVHAFLKRIGMKFLKTGGVPAKADQAAQEEFLKKNYNQR